MTSETEGWIMCAWCKEEWPAESFRASGTATRTHKVCSACWIERYPKRRVTCSACGTKMNTRGKNDFPTCRPCRATNREAERLARRQLTKAPRFCRGCGVPLGLPGPDRRGLRCHPCHNKAARERASYKVRRERGRKWDENNRERRKQYMRELRARKRAA